MRNRTRPVIAWLLPLLAAACASAPPPYNPFRVPREKFYGSLQTVALAPVDVPEVVDNAAELRTRFAQHIQERLEGAGFKVVGPAQVGPIMLAQAAKMGGLYDPATGRMDDSKRKAFVEACGAELQAQYAVSALLRADVRVVKASVNADKAQWDGLTESSTIGSFLNLFVTHSGTLPALSLLVRLSRPDGDLLYAQAGGIQLLSHIGGSGGFVDVPQSEILKDPERIRGSVDRALDPLLGKVAKEGESRTAETN
jgi:hypothetical protein